MSTVLVIAMSVIFLFPILWSIVTALKPSAEILSYPPRLLPSSPTLEQFRKLLTAGDGVFMTYVLNTIIMTISTIAIVLGISFLTAYGLAVLPFKGSKIVFLLILSIFMVPFQSLLVPLYQLLNTLHLYDTKQGLVLIYATFFMPFCIFLMKNFFHQIPTALKESAKIDGASNFMILRKIYLPLSIPAIATCTVYLFLETWNDFVLSLIFSSSNVVKNIQVGIMNFGKQRFQSDWGIINAGTVFSIIPTILLFLLLQSYYVQGMTSGAIKE